jgi:ADP-ribose pyrophosphatase YjhB (NUDIX family)
LDTEDVAKIRILVAREGELWSLLSRKDAGGDPLRHDKLEMLGGHLEVGESPREGLLRELAEEEASGELARLACEGEPAFRSAVADGAPHHLFELRIEESEASLLRHDPAESLGFEWVRTALLDAGQLSERLTPRTREILRVFGPATS